MCELRPDGVLRFRLWQQSARGGLCGRPEGSVLIPGLRPGLYSAALLPRDRTVPVGGALRRPRRHRRRSTASCRRCSPTTCSCSGGSRWRPRRSRSRACRRGSAGSATAIGRAPDWRSTSSSGRGRVSAPVVIGRDHLDSGSVASPYRETEAMRDGSDAIADWPILNALLNTAAGATWVSVHHGGGVGIGNSIHSGMVVLADGTRRGGRAARAGARRRPRHRCDAPCRRRLSRGARRRARGRARPPERGAAGRRRRVSAADGGRDGSSSATWRRSRRRRARARCAAPRSVTSR